MRCITGAFDCVDDGPSLSGNDSPPKKTIAFEVILHQTMMINNLEIFYVRSI